jgi:hypothetical protein
MNPATIQQAFFQEVKNILDPHLSMVDSVAKILNVSHDSAYRRIRGEKELSFLETKVLCSHYGVSLDKLFQVDNNSFFFTGKLADKNSFGLEPYLNYFLQQLNYFNSHKHRELFYFGKDIFIFQSLAFPELTAFKVFFWMKTFFEYPFQEYPGDLLSEMQEKVSKLGPQLNAAYNQISSVEIWTEDSINSSIRQIDYYRQNRFLSADQANHVFESLLNVISHIEKQAEAGYKFAPGDKPNPSSAPYRFFVNEFVLGENCNLLVLDDAKIAYLNHSMLNIILTRDSAFTEYIYQYAQKIMRKSSLMSSSGEKERASFFGAMRDKVYHSMKQK